MNIVAIYNAETGNDEDNIEFYFDIDFKPSIGMKIKWDDDDNLYFISDLIYNISSTRWEAAFVTILPKQETLTQQDKRDIAEKVAIHFSDHTPQHYVNEYLDKHYPLK